VRARLPRVAAVLLCAALAAPARAQTVSEDQFRVLSPPQPVSSGERIEVIEFFYYGCPVCYETEPHVAKWLLETGPGVELLRVPAVFSENSESFARTFYTLDEMGYIGRLHRPLYDNHHFDGRQLNVEKNVVAWVAGNGVDATRFSALWHSDEIKAKVEASRKVLVRYDVEGVPSFVVDGKYLTTAQLVGGVGEVMKVVDYLVNRARDERRSK